jgi:peptide/nickel transport system permease protein
MSSYIIKRLIYAVIIAWGILTITFILLRVGPSSPVDRYILNIASRGQDVESVKQAIESKYGLNKPIYEQYFDYMGNLLQGKWGWSFSSSQPVLDLIGSHWIYSFQLILLATILAILFGVGLGMLAAVKRNTKIDYAISIFSFIGISLPGFWLGLMLILVFAVQLGMFKTFYDTSYPILSLQNLRQLILPCWITCARSLSRRHVPRGCRNVR